MSSECQPVYLQPELDITNGLQSNSVRVIKEDNQNRIWLGTDHGLVVLNDNGSLFRSITDKFSGHQIYGLAFNKDHVFIGSKFNGLYIFNLLNRQLEKHFDTSQIGLCLKVKAFRDTIFFGTSKSAFYIVTKNGEWNLTKISCADIGVFPDFALWQNKIYAPMYEHGNQFLYQFQNDSLVRSPLFKLYEFPIDMLLGLAITANDRFLVVGGDGFDVIVNKNQQKKFESLSAKNTGKSYPIWDAEIADSRVYLATGNPDNNQQGMIYEPSKSDLGEVNNSFYGECLFYDKEKKGMWAGTFNRGLYYWPAINESYSIPNSKSEYKFKPINRELGLLFNNDKVYKTDLENNEFNEIFDGSGQKDRKQILDAIGWKDTTAILLQGRLFLVNDSGTILKSFPATQGNYIHKKGDLIYVFSLYYDFVVVINIKNNTSVLKPCPSNQITASLYNNGNLFYHSTYTGFFYFDSISHPFNIQFPLVESYTISADTLWILHAGLIQTFRIDLPNYKLIPLFEKNIKEKVEGVSPKWIINNKGHIYCGDNKGFLDIEASTGNPHSYTYLGNFSQGETPASDGNFLFFNNQNYISKIDSKINSFEIIPSSVKVEIEPVSTIFEGTPFILHFKSEDYIIQKHTLKEVEILRKGNLIRTVYIINDQLEFPSGMKRGNYILKFKINGVYVGEKNIKIQIPLTSNPLFYALIGIFIILFLFILFKFILNKRTYDRHILENRLQLLKQNLNPHFIFNSLNLIYSLVLQRKNESAIKSIADFSDLHRYYLDNINKSEITLEEELKFIESYLRLESARVEVDSPFIYQLPADLTKEIKSVLVPPMILQPLVENAVKHCDGHSEIMGSVWVDVFEKGKQILIAVENTIGYSGTKATTSNGMGLRLVLERIEIFNKTFNKNLSLETGKSTLYCTNGYRVELLIDKR